MGWWLGDVGISAPLLAQRSLRIWTGNELGAVTLLSGAQHRCQGEGIKVGAGVPIRPEPHLSQEINGPAAGDDRGPFFVVSARSWGQRASTTWPLGLGLSN